jgi:GNAT superfamily N-acetyltransferase
MRVQPEFRAVARSEVDAAYAVYLEVFEWLRAKGVRQWLHALPFDVFLEREREKELFGCFVEQRVAAVVSLALESNPYWPELGTASGWWIKTLAVDRRLRGEGIGRATVRGCEDFVWNAGAGEIFLDCVDVGFLPRYYAGMEYTVLGRKEITYPSGNTFHVALMKKEAPNKSSPPMRSPHGSAQTSGK